jgi:hypothetical protein
VSGHAQPDRVEPGRNHVGYPRVFRHHQGEWSRPVPPCQRLSRFRPLPRQCPCHLDGIYVHDQRARRRPPLRLVDPDDRF